MFILQIQVTKKGAMSQAGHSKKHKKEKHFFLKKNLGSYYLPIEMFSGSD